MNTSAVFQKFKLIIKDYRLPVPRKIMCVLSTHRWGFHDCQGTLIVAGFQISTRFRLQYNSWSGAKPQNFKPVKYSFMLKSKNLQNP